MPWWPFGKLVMYILYNVILICLLILLSPVWICVLLSGKKYRAGFKQKCGFLPAEIREKIKSFCKQPVWFHAVSVGETLAVIDLVKEFHCRTPDVPVIFSTVTYTGQEIAKKRLVNIATVIYFPYDLAFITKKVINLIKPQLAIIVETEIWPSFTFELARKNIPLLLINGRLSPKSSKNYRLFRFFFSKVLENFTQLMMQAEIDANRMLEMGADKTKVTIAGNLKYDIKAKFNADDIRNLKQNLALTKDDKVIIAGSTHSGEEEILVNSYIKLKEFLPSLKLILVPRHPERHEEVIELLKSKELEFGRRSHKDTFEKAPVFMLDTMGELSGFYSIADIAFVGGSMIQKGGHNPLEPAAYSVPVVVGPHTFNFLDITNYMIESGAAIQVKDEESFYAVLKDLLTDQNVYNNARNACLKVFDANRGATEKSLNIIYSLLN
ncbi:MAG: 3-deoxy-D-manno-octulosonic acid transferase [Cyanobacteriota bacterium]